MNNLFENQFGQTWQHPESYVKHKSLTEFKLPFPKVK